MSAHPDSAFPYACYLLSHSKSRSRTHPPGRLTQYSVRPENIPAQRLLYHYHKKYLFYINLCGNLFETDLNV